MLEDPRLALWSAEVAQMSDASLAGGILRAARGANATAINIFLDASSLFMLRPAMTCQSPCAGKTSLALRALERQGPARGPICLLRWSLPVQNGRLKMDTVHETRPRSGVGSKRMPSLCAVAEGPKAVDVP